MKDPRIAIVEWEDASDDEDVWIYRKNAPAAVVVTHRQVGYVLSVTKSEVLLTSTVSESYLGKRTRIPRGMVRSITYLAV